MEMKKSFRMYAALLSAAMLLSCGLGQQLRTQQLPALWLQQRQKSRQKRQKAGKR